MDATLYEDDGHLVDCVLSSFEPSASDGCSTGDEAGALSTAAQCARLDEGGGQETVEEVLWMDDDSEPATAEQFLPFNWSEDGGSSGNDSDRDRDSGSGSREGEDDGSSSSNDDGDIRVIHDKSAVATCWTSGVSALTFAASTGAAAALHYTAASAAGGQGGHRELLAVDDEGLAATLNETLATAAAAAAAAATAQMQHQHSAATYLVDSVAAAAGIGSSSWDWVIVGGAAGFVLQSIDGALSFLYAPETLPQLEWFACAMLLLGACLELLPGLISACPRLYIAAIVGIRRHLVRLVVWTRIARTMAPFGLPCFWLLPMLVEVAPFLLLQSYELAARQRKFKLRSSLLVPTIDGMIDVDKLRILQSSVCPRVGMVSAVLWCHLVDLALEGLQVGGVWPPLAATADRGGAMVVGVGGSWEPEGGARLLALVAARICWWCGNAHRRREGVAKDSTEDAGSSSSSHMHFKMERPRAM
jgi:hypothetical protein